MMSCDRRRCGRETRWREREQKQKQKAGGSRKHKGFPLQSPPPLDEHQLDAEESEIGRKGIEPKVRARMQRGAPAFLVWNSVTFSGAWARFSKYSQVFPSIP